MYSRLYYISQGKTPQEQFENIQYALDGGCKWVQLRFKNDGAFNDIVTLAERVKTICASYNAAFIMNDNVHVAKSVDADGVHLGLRDMPVPEARVILGADKIIGGTANTLADVQLRIQEKCNYIGLGPFRFTTTKEKLSPVLGLEGYKSIVNEILASKVEMPIYAIGGIAFDDVEQLMTTGIYGVAISGAITKHSNKPKLIENINALLYGKINNC